MTENEITVCICTFKRPALLLRSLEGIEKQVTEGQFSFSIVVADNDGDRSAQLVVEGFASRTRVSVAYTCEPVQNIALVRNKAISEARGEYIAFIDDDEVPGEDWLARLFHARAHLDCDGVLGPVLPYFETTPPAWVTKGKFFDRPHHETGRLLNWAQCRTGNVLFRRSILSSVDTPFRSQFGTAGEDMDFFRRMIENGFTFRWCAEAPVFELVPDSRCSERFMIKRALLRGSNFPKHPSDRVKNIAKSIVAIPTYTLAMPLFAVIGKHCFMKYLIKLVDHSARLLAFSGIPLASEREI